MANLFSTHHPAPAPAASAPLPNTSVAVPAREGSVDSILRAPGSGPARRTVNFAVDAALNVEDA